MLDTAHAAEPVDGLPEHVQQIVDLFPPVPPRLRDEVAHLLCLHAASTADKTAA